MAKRRSVSNYTDVVRDYTVVQCCSRLWSHQLQSGRCELFGQLNEIKFFLGATLLALLEQKLLIILNTNWRALVETGQ